MTLHLNPVNLFPFLFLMMYVTYNYRCLCRLFFKIDLLTDIAVLCLTDFIDLRYIHSVICIFDTACELLPPLTKEQYCTCVLLPLYLTFSLTSPLPKLNVLYVQTVCDWGGGGGVELSCRPYSTGVLHSVSGQIQNLQNCRGWCL
jgi:hypothetical protein